MDVSKLDKMKVVDLRNELQTRGLDTKGVKAVLVERLRAYLESGEGSGAATPSTPGTPGRRSRRTRSMTRSPSPSIVKAAEPELEPLDEEEEASNNAGNSEQDDMTSARDEEEEQDDFNEVAAVEANASEQDEESADADYLVANAASNRAATAVEQEEVEDAEQDEEEEETEQVVQELKQQQQQQQQQEYEEEPTQVEKQDDDESESLTLTTAENSTNADDNQATADNAQVESEKKHDVSERRASHRKRSHSRSRSHSKERKERHKSRDRSKSRSRTRSRSRHRHSRGSLGKEEVPVQEDEPTIEDKQFGLSWFDSDLFLRIDPVTFTTAKPINNELYALVWAGARANYGVREGKVCFEVRLSEEVALTRHSLLRDEPNLHGFRVGFSMPNSSLLLGEAEKSFAYCENARKALNSEFSEYGKPYKLDDVIGCYLDLDSTPANIKYTLNGEDLGVAFEFDKQELLGESDALYPHISTKGYEFIVNFADNDNLLVNAERPIRKRRKPRKISQKSEKEVETNAAEKTANAEAAEEDKPQTTDEQTAIEAEPQNADKQVDAEVAAAAADDDVEMRSAVVDEAKIEQTVDAEDAADTKTNETEAAPPVAMETVAEETETTDQPAAANGDVATAKEDKTDETAKSTEEAVGPSPNKRARRESNKRRDTISEDEYEEVVPEPREHVNLLPGYELIALIPEEKYVPGPQRPENRKECEVILLIGLPGAGKTQWAQTRITEQPEKRYHIIGADALIDKMTIDGQPRKTVHKGRWDKIYDLCLNSLSELEEIATKRRRNFILDQTNAYASAQRRKMKGFSDFKRIAVVCIPTDDELKRRNTEKSDKGNPSTLRETTVNNLRANFTLPSLEFGWFEDIIYTDLNADEAKDVVKNYNEKGKKAIDASAPRDNKRRRDDRRRYDDNRQRNYRNDNRWNDRRTSGYGGGGSGGAGNRWGNSGGGGGSGYRGYGYGNSGGGNMNSGGGGARGYDNRNRYNAPHAQQNWVGGRNDGRRRNDDRYGSGRSAGGNSGSRFDSYGGGSGGGRDYRNRDRDRNGSGSSGARRDNNYRSGNRGQAADFRSGHRDIQTEDSRGGYERSVAAVSKSNGGYDQYNKGSNSSSAAKGGKWVTYSQINQQQPSQQQRYQGGGGAGGNMNWPQQQQQQQYQQAHATANSQQAQQHQSYWGYQQMQGYDAQQQWQNTDPQTQQQWMSWWQQHQNQPPPTQSAGTAQHAVGGSSSGNDGNNSYWSSYPYSANQSSNSGGNADKK